MGTSIDGLASSMDTTGLINALMDVQSIPRTLLRSKITDKNTIISQLQSLNSAVQDIASKAKQMSAPGALSLLTVSSSSAAVTATAGSTAAALSADIVVDRVATRHTVVTAAYTAWPDSPPVLTLEDTAGQRVQVTAASTSLADVARAINEAGAGVTATVVPAGTDGLGAPLSRLQLSATETGASAAFQAHLGDIAAVQAGTARDLAAEPGAATVAVGADAQLRLWAGTAAEQVVTSSGNTFRELFPGVEVTAAQASATPVTVTIAPDSTARTKAAGDFVTQLATILSRISKGSTATVGAPGESTTLGVFTGDSTVRALRGALEKAIQYPVDGVSPSSIGITIDRYGALTFDAEKFAAAMADDAAAAGAVFAGLATRVQETATTYSDKYEGLLTSRVTGQQDEVRALDEQVERWDLRLAQRKATLERTYARMETMLSQLQGQSSYLSSQLANLPTWESKS